MTTKFLCRNCSQIRNRPIRSACNFFGDGTQHDWTPFSASDDLVGWEDATANTFSKSVGVLMAIAFSCLMFFVFEKTKTHDEAIGGLPFFAAAGFLIGGFYRQIIKIILGLILFFGICWTLDHFKIIDLSSKSNENPPKVKKVSK
jgi:hypothetical protein